MAYDVVECATGRVCRGGSGFQKLQHGGGHLRVGEAARLCFALIGESSRLRHVEVHDRGPVQRTDSGKCSDGSVHLEADEFHERLQLMA